MVVGEELIFGDLCNDEFNCEGLSTVDNAYSGDGIGNQ